ncbi:MAG: cbb3-type cytochrome c oxidase N-terminal domain-containing protein [Planctomycetaceae bacterium]
MTIPSIHDMNNNDTQNDHPSVVEDSIPDDELTGHVYDGIQEYDNPLPGWWKWLFVASILACPPYWVFYHSGTGGRTAAERYELALADNARLQFAEVGELEGDRGTLVKYMNQKSWLSFGKSIYQTNCISCHKADGSGLVGPNLTDDHYKNVQQIEDIYSVIVKGAGGAAMPSWKNRLSQNEIVLVSAYVASLRGAPTGPSARPPEGYPISPWPALEEIAPAGDVDAAGDTGDEK